MKQSVEREVHREYVLRVLGRVGGHEREAAVVRSHDGVIDIGLLRFLAGRRGMVREHPGSLEIRKIHGEDDDESRA